MKTLAQMKEQRVEIRLFVAEGGSVTLRQNEEGRSVTTNGGARAYVNRIGEERLWAAIDNVTLGTKVFRVQ
jgi:hypothetical protein